MENQANKPRIIYRGYIMAIKDCSNGFTVGHIENEDSSIEPELFKKASEARKEKRELASEMDYQLGDMFTAPASFNKDTKILKIYSRNPDIKKPEAIIDFNGTEQVLIKH